MPKHLLYNQAEIRDELYAVWNQIQELWNAHLLASARSSAPHLSQCNVCAMYRHRQHGISDAIRHFGGRVRRNN